MTESFTTTGAEPNATSESGQSGWGGSTQWTVLTLAVQTGAPGAVDALNKLCLKYLPPVYAYIRRRGYDACEAKDLTQGFIASFMQKDVLSGVDRSKGRFRSLLLVSLKNFLASEWERSHAQKRGGGQPLMSLDELAAEEGICAVAPDLTPDEFYDWRWAMSALKQAVALLQVEEEAAGAVRGAQFKRLQAFLTGNHDGDKYQAAGRDLGLSSNAVAMAVHRLRLRFGAVLRAVVGATVGPHHVDEEIQSLMAALRPK